MALDCDRILLKCHNFSCLGGDVGWWRQTSSETVNWSKFESIKAKLDSFIINWILHFEIFNLYAPNSILTSFMNVAGAAGSIYQGECWKIFRFFQKISLDSSNRTHFLSYSTLKRTQIISELSARHLIGIVSGSKKNSLSALDTHFHSTLC